MNLILPGCESTNCAANVDHHCIALDDIDFDGKCPFFKEKETEEKKESLL